MVPRSKDCVERAEQNFNQIGSVEVVKVLFSEVPLVACLNTCDNEVAFVFF